MTKILIFIGLISIPFIINPLSILPVIPHIDGGTRPPKEFIAFIFSFAIILSALFNGEIKSFKNKWYLIFLFYIPFAIWHSPPYIMLFGAHNIAGSWQWKPFYYILVYTLLIVSISNLKFTKKEIRYIFSTITVIGVLMALYVIVQRLNIEQFFSEKSFEIIGVAKNPKIMGTMGNSTLVSAFMVMCLPFCFYLKKWIKAAILICAVLICQSQMSTGTMIVCCALYWFIFAPITRPYLGTLCVVGILAMTYFGINHTEKFRSLVGDNGRFILWQQMIEDIKSPPIKKDINTPGLTADQIAYLKVQNIRTYAMTGLGLGSFKIMYAEKHKTPIYHQGKLLGYHYPKWGSPHNVYMHLAWTVGVIGLGLVLIIIWTTLWPLIFLIKFEPTILPVFISVISVLILSVATFILEIEPTRFYSAILMGFLLNGGLIGCAHKTKI